MKFETKVRKMTAKQIIMAMVTALKHPPIINVDMDTFGSVKIRKDKKVCFGCAATNTICQITNKKFTIANIKDREKRSTFINCTNFSFLATFEIAIDQLRCGNIQRYNNYAKFIGIASIFLPYSILLPCLYNNYTNEDLQPYIKLANSQIL